LSSEDAVFEALSHETRRRIIRILKEKPLAYSEMLEALVVETGALNYHLGKLKGLVEKSEDGTYMLTPLGVKAYEVLRCYEGGVGRKDGDKSVLSALSDMLLYPHRVYDNPDAYGFFHRYTCGAPVPSRIRRDRQPRVIAYLGGGAPPIHYKHSGGDIRSLS